MNIARLCAFITLISLMVFAQANAKVVFEADFEDPNNPANNEDNWNAGLTNPNAGWQVVDLAVDFPETGRTGHALWFAADGCLSAGVTTVPWEHSGTGWDGTFTDGIIDIQASYGDDDAVGVTFREQPGEPYVLGEINNRFHPEVWGTGYQVVYGQNQLMAVELLDIAEGCAIDASCVDYNPLPLGRGTDLDGNGVVEGPEEDDHHCAYAGGLDPEEAGPGDMIVCDVCWRGDGVFRALAWRALVDMDFEAAGIRFDRSEANPARGNLPQDNSYVVFGRVRVDGPQIDIWYGDVVNVNPEAIAAGMPPVLSHTISGDDPLYTSAGSVGIWNESWGNSMIDNIVINDDPGDVTAVDAQGKLATYWGAIKASK
jgi:hypothetical protein